MKALRFLVAGVALLALGSCGKEYNAIPGGNNTDNPLLPLGVAAEGQIRYNLWGDKIRIYNAYRTDTLYDGLNTYKRALGLYVSDSNKIQFISLSLKQADTVKQNYTSRDSLLVNISFQDASDLDGTTLRIYTNQVTVNSNFQVNYSELNSVMLRGSFSGRLMRGFPSIDTNDFVEINNGTFWVKKS